MGRIWRNIDKNKELLTLAAKSKAFIVLDTETTGLKKDDEIIEFAGCKCAFHQGEFRIYDTLHLYIKPTKPMPPEATAANNITDEFLADKPSAKEVFPMVQTFLGDSPVIGAYNSAFDIRMLNGFYRQNGQTLNVGLEIDILKIAKDVFCGIQLKDHKLATIANTYGVDKGIVFHSALDDTRVTIRVVNALIKDIKENGSKQHLRDVKLYRLNYYPGYKGNSRLYAVTSCGTIYYDIMKDSWFPNDKNLSLDSIDMQSLEDQVFHIAWAKDEWKAEEKNDYKELRRICKTKAFIIAPKEATA